MRPSSRDLRPGARRAVDAALVLAVVIAGVVAVSTVVVRATILDESTYTQALTEADAFERIYTDVLPDPEVVAVQEALLGELRVPAPLATQARALATSAVRWALPPEAIQSATERAVGDVLAYVRGDVPQLVVDIDLQPVAARLDDAVRTQVAALLGAHAPQLPVPDLASFRAEVADMVDQLADGRLPASIPQLADAGASGELVAALLDPLGDRVDPELRRRVEAALAAGRQREAVVDVALVALGEHVREVTSTWGDRPAAPRPIVEVTGVIEDRAQARTDAVVGTLDDARRAASVADPWVTAVALLVGLAAGGALMWRRRRDLVGGAQVLGGALVAAGLVTAGLWWALGRRIDEPLDRATGTGPGTWDLPLGVRDLLADVQAELGSALRHEVLWRAAVPLVVGLVLVVVPALPRLARRLPALARRVPAVGSRPLVGGAVAVAIVLGAGLVVGAPTEADPERACNGHVELCDRPYDEVVQPATHNSMSSPDVVEIWPEHDGDIAAQLDAGIRALLIDTHHWTAMVSADDLQRRAPGTSDAVADALWPLVRPFAEERPGTFLCHNHCAFGGMPFVDALDDVRAFLDANPDDVVTLVIQDAISVEETEAAFAEARLASYLYEPSGAGWPTLGEMIDDGERLVVFAEVEGPPPAWYLHAFDEMQETPFTVLRPDAFTCEPNRGPDDASLFLLNHWVQRVAPDRADALEVNAHDVLVDRARRCTAERGQLPDFLAVNFYSLGDVVGAADTLNGVG